jgi:hypothetical protein
MLEGLNARDREILAFEAAWQRRMGNKEFHVRHDLALSMARYYQLLNRILDDPQALEHDPANVNRLRRLRDDRAAARQSRLL